MTAITIVGTATTNAALGTSWAITLPSTVQSGDVLLFAAYKENSATVTLPSGEGYSAADPTQNAEANGTNFWSYWYKADLQAADASATHTFSWTGSVWRQAAAIILRGASAIASQLDTDPPAAQIDTTTNSATVVCPADTSVTADDLAVWLALTFDSLGSTWPATNDGNTVTERFDDTNNVHMATAPYPTAGTVSSLSATKSAATGQDTGKTFLVKATAAPSALSQASAAALGPSVSSSSVAGKGAWAGIRPVLDVSIGTWTDQAGATSDLHSPLAEVPFTDATYDQAGWPTTDVLEERLHPFALPTPANSFTFSYRYGKDNPQGQRVDVQVELRQGASTQIASWTHADISGSVAEADQALSAPQIALITDPTDVRVRVTQTRFQTP